MSEEAGLETNQAERIPRKPRTRRAIISEARELKKLSETDDLTGLPNRRAYKKRLAEEADRSRRTQTIATIMSVDLDHFKLINDKHGHSAGDEKLKTAAEAFKQTVRSTDFVARAGEKGDEFKFIFPGTDRTQVWDIWNMRLKPITESMGIQLSAGAAEIDPDNPEASDEESDLALRSAKEDLSRKGNTLMVKEPIKTNG